MGKEEFRQWDPTHVGSRSLTFATGLFALVTLMIGADLFVDYRAGVEPAHMLTESVMMALAVVGFALLWRQFSFVQHRAEQLTVDVHAARREAQRFREEAYDSLRGLGEAIERQFTRWALTPAEREIGLLLLKGLSHKEIAEIRATGETTIRQQALAIYRKSGVRSRTELSAFFLEDLLLPVDQR